jgi:hypothetical protein
MPTQEPQSAHEGKAFAVYFNAALGILLIPVFAIVACLTFPYMFILRWLRQHQEHSFRMKMKSSGRLIPWQEFLRSMHESGGTCIEERFSPKGPVRFWWTQENVYGESPYPIIDWFNMRKGRQAEPFIRWCRERYTGSAAGNAVLVDTGLVAKRDIYALWSECRSDSPVARWVEVAPPEILPNKSGT